MNKLLATLIAGVFAAVSTAAVAQTATPAPAPAPAPSVGEKAKEKVEKAQTTPKAKANVAASKAQSAKREKMPNIKSLTKEQRAELLRQLQKESTP